MKAARAALALALALATAAALGCGGGESGGPPPTFAPSDLIGTWAAQLSPPSGAYSGCTFSATFRADGTYESGLSCNEAHQVDVQSQAGAYTFSLSGRVNFLASAWACAGEATNFYADFSGTAARPTITVGPPRGYVLVRNSGPTVPDGAAPGCFGSDWTFTPAAQ